MSELKAIIFDVDGTLADTEKEGHRVAFNRTFTEAGLEWNWTTEIYGDLLSVSGGKERIRHYLTLYHPHLKITDQEIAQFHLKKTEHYQAILAEGTIQLRIGVDRLIKSAKNQGIRLAIATTSAIPNVIPLLNKHLDIDCFEIIAGGDIVPHKKPAPDIYQYVLKYLNLSPENCLVFEDSCHGLTASVGAGLKTVITFNQYTQNQDFSEALLVLNHLGEPDNPFTVIKGNNYGETYMNLNLVHALMSEN